MNGSKKIARSLTIPTFQDVAKAVATVADALDLSLDDEELRKRMTKRLQPFADQILPNRTLQVTVDGKETLKLGPGLKI